MIFKGVLGWMFCVAMLLLYLLSTTVVARLLISRLENIPPISESACQKADAIVVLGGGRPRNSPELEGCQPTALSLERIRYTALLYRRCGLPILASGGGDRCESETIANVLRADYGVETEWLERQSLTTWENALLSRSMLGESVSKVIVVTHAWHMPRAILSFERAGFQVIPAPTAYNNRSVLWQSPSNWLPRVKNLRLSEIALHEYIGYVWYWFTSRQG